MSLGCVLEYAGVSVGRGRGGECRCVTKAPKYRNSDQSQGTCANRIKSEGRSIKALFCPKQTHS